MADYQLTATDIIIRTADHVSIPPGHRFYDDYLAWVALGNTADAYVAPPPDVPLADPLAELQKQIDTITAMLQARQ